MASCTECVKVMADSEGFWWRVHDELLPFCSLSCLQNYRKRVNESEEKGLYDKAPVPLKYRELVNGWESEGGKSDLH